MDMDLERTRMFRVLDTPQARHAMLSPTGVCIRSFFQESPRVLTIQISGVYTMTLDLYPCNPSSKTAVNIASQLAER